MTEKKKKDNVFGYVKRFWNYMWHDDSLGSYFWSLLFAFVVIKFLFFPGLGLILNNDYPIVAIVSESMEHKIVDGNICSSIVLDQRNKNLNIDEWWSLCGKYYENNLNLTKSDFADGDFPYKNGLNIGDVMILYGKDYSNIEVGDVLVFVPEDKSFFENYGPVIHRVVEITIDEDGKYHFKTKGDHNPRVIENFEDDISEEDVIGVAVARVPWIGYVKILPYKLFMLATGRSI